MSYCLKAASRGSKLARAQTAEVLEAIRYFDPSIEFDTTWIHTQGDADRTTDLRTLGKTDFFTKEIDEGLLRGDFRLGIHSAKDLPEKIPEGLFIATITAGLDPRDTLVAPNGLEFGARVGVSSLRREEVLKQFRADLKPVSIRGTIEERLLAIEKGDIEALIVPESALIRLHLNPPRIFLPGQTAPLQGQLAVVVREEDEEMKDLFSKIDVRKKTLYFGLDPGRHPKKQYVTHYPLIRTEERDLNDYEELWDHFSDFSWLILTSKTAVHWLLKAVRLKGLEAELKKKKAVCVGLETARKLKELGLPCLTAEPETAEGLLPLLEGLKQEKFLYLHGAKARPVIKNYLSQERFDFCALIVYDTLYVETNGSLDLEAFDDFFFTSPSTVEAFFARFQGLPQAKPARAIGPITKEALCQHINSRT